MALTIEVLYVAVQILCFLTVIDCFNLDTKIPVIKKGPKTGAYFGYSVAEHQTTKEDDEGNTVLDKNYLLVGAPKANSSNVELSTIHQPGEIYKCTLDTYTDNCNFIDIDQVTPNCPSSYDPSKHSVCGSAGITEDQCTKRRCCYVPCHGCDSKTPWCFTVPIGNGATGEDKDNQWLGVTLYSQGKGQAILTCAHRFKKYGPNYIFGFGLCISATNNLDFDKTFEPCAGRSVENGHLEFAYCQAGTSAFVAKDGTMLTGAPGVGNWRGSVFKNTLKGGLNVDKNWYYSPALKSTPENGFPEPPVATNSYLGMSTTAGKLSKDSSDTSELTYVAGAPRADNIGKVILFRKPRVGAHLIYDEEDILMGERFGSMFGASVCTIDLNHDGKDDLVVGSPFYGEKERQRDRSGGAIYVYMNEGEGINNRIKPVRILGRKMSEADCKLINCEHARFGASLANLGDINIDGYDDLAVGAPYEGNGVVYIYHGSVNGIVTEPAQRITAEDMPSVLQYKAFGHAISGGMDLDGNGYNDVLIGAYESDSIALLRARPIVTVTAEFEKPEKINPHSYDCPDGTKLSCQIFKLCFKYTEPTKKFTSQITVRYKFEVDIDNQIPRLKFQRPTDPSNEGVVEADLDLVGQGVKKCQPETVYVKNGTKEILRPIPFRLTWTLVENQPRFPQPGQPLPDIQLYPILEASKAKQEFIVNFEKKCGDDDICHTDLTATAVLRGLRRDKSGAYIISVRQDTTVFLDITLTKMQEPAYEAILNITFPASFQLSGTTSAKNRVCSKEDNRLSCELDNPFEASRETLTIRFNTKNVEAQDGPLYFNINVHTTSTDVDPQNDALSIKMVAIVETDLLIRGVSSPEQVFYSGEVKGESAIRFEEEIGTYLKHTYEIKNEVPDTVDRTIVHISWPSEVANDPKYEHGKRLLYLIREPVVRGGGEGSKCHMKEGQVNPLNIQITAPVTEAPPTTTGPSYTVDSNSTDEDTEVVIGGKVKRRTKREDKIVLAKERIGSSGKVQRVVTMDCEKGTAWCINFDCVILKPPPKTSSVVIDIEARLWNSTFLEDYRDVDFVEINSVAEIEIPSELNIVQKNTTNDKHTITTIAEPQIPVRPKEEIAWWIILIAVLAGVLLLVILILVLWKLGFFKRRRPEYESMAATHSVTVEKGDKNKYKYDPVNTVDS